MADDSINRYKEMLAAYQQTQQDLSNTGLPEATDAPVQDMIDKAIADEKEASKMAQLRKLQVKNDEDELSDSNLTEEQRADIETTRKASRNSVTGLPSAEELAKRKEELAAGYKGRSQKPVTPPVAVPSPEVGVAPASTLSPLEQAKKDRKQQEAYANILEGVQKAAAAYGGGNLVNLKADTSAADRLRQTAQRDVAEAEKSEKQKAAEQKAAAELARQERLDRLNTLYKTAQINKLQKAEAGATLSKDPNSLESKAAQDQAMSLMGSLGIKYDPKKISNLSAETLGSKNFTAGLRKSVNNLSEKRLEATEAERFNKWTEKREDDLTKAIDKFNADKEVVRANNMISGAKIARDMVASGNPIAAASIPNFLARASGEVGALTEADKEPFGGTRAIVERSKQAAKQMIDGTLTEANKQFVLDLADVYEKSAQNVRNERADMRAAQLGGIDFPIEMIRGRFLGTDKTELPKQTLPKTSRNLTGQDKAAYDWAKANENDPRAKQILKKLGME
jgi:hypothetical protein